MPPKLRDVLQAQNLTVQEDIANGVTPKTANSKDTHWKIWNSFCRETGIDPFLRDYDDPVPFLTLFGHGYHQGHISASGKSVTATTVSNVLCSIGQVLLRMGAKDPRISQYNGKLDFRLARQMQCWKKSEPPPLRVRPVPITVVTFILNLAYSPVASRRAPAECALADMICAAFFFLLRPGEYTGTTNDDAAFHLENVSLFLGSRKLGLSTAPTRELEAATSVSLYFTTQKNQRKGDSIAHGKSLHPLCCPVRSITRLILRHRTHFRTTGRPFDPHTKLASYYTHNRNHSIRAADVTKQLRFAATAIQHTTGISPSDISARSLRAGGAMALLCGHTDKDTIMLLGRWHSDAMMRYLHQDCLPVMNRLARTMFNNGKYSFLPSQTVPTVIPPDPVDVPPATIPRPPAPPPAAPALAVPAPPAPPTSSPRRSRRQQGIAPGPTPDTLPHQLRPHNRPPTVRLR